MDTKEIPSTGATGEEGSQGEPGKAATIRVGTVTTGEPGTPAEVVNVGSDEDAILEFTIPRGADGGSGGSIQSLAITDTAIKTVTSETPVVFTQPAYVDDATVFGYTPGRAEIELRQPGVYQVFFHCTIRLAAGASIPEQIFLELYLNGSPVPGSAVRHTFLSSAEISNLTLSTSVQTVTAPAPLVVFVEVGNFVITDSSFTIIRLQ